MTCFIIRDLHLICNNAGEKQLRVFLLRPSVFGQAHLFKARKTMYQYGCGHM